MNSSPPRLTLDDLRLYARISGIGYLYLPDDLVNWNGALGPAVNDSRLASPGALFIALPGEHADGYRFIPDAIERGARAVIAAGAPDPRPTRAVTWVVPDPLAALQSLAGWWRGRFSDLSVIGVTGSVGKTTAKDVMAAALGRLLPTLASPRSFNNEIGLPLTLLSLTAAHRAAVLEMGIYDIGDIAFLAGIARQTIGVVLNVEAVHLARAGTIERLAQAKAEMITTLPANGIAALNHDDPRTLAMSDQAPGPVRTFGLTEGAHWQGVDLEAH
ncbi:MAG: UDP-N-acetylmuramoyl-tripeptide--D-alanyl-D-alanine ligase, partial [Chloroflexota bacterium]